MTIAISWISIAATQLVVGINHDALLSWQKPLWKDDPRMILLMVTDVNDQAGCYSFSGDAPRGIDGGTGSGKNDYCFHKPLEFFWRTPGKGVPPEPEHWAPSSWENKAWGFQTVDVGRGHYMLSTQGIHIMVRYLGDRWVGIMQVEGEPIATYYWYISVKYTFGVPSGVNYINMHGYRIQDCAIDYSQPVMKQYKRGDPWELVFGIDPIIACPAEPSDGKDTGEPCGKVMPELLRKHIKGQPSYEHFLIAIPVNLLDTAKRYNIGDLSETACERLPQRLDGNLSENAEYCVKYLAHSITLTDHSMMYSLSAFGESRIDKMMKLSDTQARNTLDGPRLSYLTCLASYGAPASIKDENKRLTNSLEDVQYQLRAVLSQAKPADPGTVDSGGGQMVLACAAALSILSILSNICVCCYCYCTGARSRVPLLRTTSEHGAETQATDSLRSPEYLSFELGSIAAK